MPKMRLVVIGGGAAGHQVAYTMRETMDVTLVDPKTYWEVPMAVPRLLVEPDALQARMSFQSFMPGVRHVQGRAIGLSDHSVEVALNDHDEQIPFDYAVLATGSRYLDPLIKAQAPTESQRSAEIEAANRALRQAHSVVVAGGGPVGVETAAELRESFPHISVTLVHGGAQLLDRAPSKFGGWAEKELRSRGVQILLNERVAEPPLGGQPIGGEVRTMTGRTLKADRVVWAVGTEPVTNFVAASFPSAVQSDGLLKTDSFLRLEGHPHIFVAGDITNLPEGRLAITTGFHVKSIAANLKALLETPAGGVAKLKLYAPKLPGKGMGKMMIVTLGRRDGLTSLPFGQFRASFMARQIKAKDMLVGMSRKAVGLT